MTETTDHTRAIEDRLLVIETKLEAVATKTDVAEAKTDVLRWYVALTLINQAALLLVVIAATIVNHFWK